MSTEIQKQMGSLPVAATAVILAAGAVVLLVIGNGVVAMAAAMSAILLAVLALSGPQQRTGALVFLAFTSFAAPSFVFVPPDNTALSLTFRLAGLVLIMLALSSGTVTTKLHISEYRWVWIFVAPIELFIIFATVPHGQWADLATYTVGGVVLALALISISKLRSTAALVATAIWVMLLAMALASLVLGVLMPEIGTAGGRLRGIFGNANTLGFFAFLLIGATVLTRRPSWVSMAAVLVGSSILLLTASRASALAAIIVMASWLVSRRPLTTFVGALLGGAAFLSLLSSELLSDVSLLRLNNSRSNTVSAAIAEGLSSPLFGIGLSNESTTIASSPLRAFSNAGTVGLIAVLLLWVLLASSTLRARPLAGWFALGAIMHSMLEGWLLSPISPLLIVFAALWWAVTRVSPVDDKWSRWESAGLDLYKPFRASKYAKSRNPRVGAGLRKDSSS